MPSDVLTPIHCRRSPIRLSKCPSDETKLNSTASNQATKTDPMHFQAMEMTNSGVDQGLTVLLDTQKKEYVTTTYQAVGFKVIFLQESKTPPGLNNEGIVVSPGNEVFIPVRVSSTYTTTAALSLQPNARRCFTDGEKQLCHYPHYYSYEACKSDYVAARMVLQCNCRDYHMPGTERICITREDIDCLHRLFGAFQNASYFDEELHKRCYPRCNTTSYTTSPTYGTLSRSQMQNPSVGAKYLIPLIRQLCKREDVERTNEESPEAFTEIVDYVMENVALVHVYFGQSTGTQYKKDVNATPSQIQARRTALLAQWFRLACERRLPMTCKFYDGSASQRRVSSGGHAPSTDRSDR
ncbi:acid-sensing ion channel 2-like, partial [Penaeus japonicus]|uniref:acid-sensing ion channel 2-like n=1 Tax=Penaeus japonicus TaxID=27405 RepID=UPI001C7121F8